MIYSVLDQDFLSDDINTVTINKNGVLINVIDKGNGEGEIYNIISTNPRDYLNPVYAPGRRISLSDL